MSRFFYWDEGWVLCVCAGEQLTREKAPPASDTNPHISPSTKYKWESVYKLKHGHKSKHKLKHIHTNTRKKFTHGANDASVNMSPHQPWPQFNKTSFVPRTSKSSPIYINIAYPSLTLIFSLSGSFWAPIEVLYLKQLPSECYRPHQTSYLYSNPCFIISRMGWNKGNTFMFTLKLVWTINYNTSDEIHNPKFCFTKDSILCDCLIDVAEWSLPRLLLKGLVSRLLTFLFHFPAWPVGKTFEGCPI